MLSHTRRNGLIGVGGRAHCGTEKTLAALLQGRVGRPFAKWRTMFVFQRATRRVGAPQLCRRAPLCRMRLQNLRRRWGSEKHRIGRRRPKPEPPQPKRNVCVVPTAGREGSVHPHPPSPVLPFTLCRAPAVSRVPAIGRVLETMGKEGHWPRTSTYNTLLWYFRQERWDTCSTESSGAFVLRTFFVSESLGFDARRSRHYRTVTVYLVSTDGVWCFMPCAC